MAAVQRGGNFPQQGQQQQNQQVQDGSAPVGADPTLKLAAISPGQVQGDDQRRTKSGRFTMSQLRQTDGIVPLQYGTNQFDSQKGKTGFGTPRNTSTRVEFADQGKRWQVEEMTHKDNLIRLQSGTNRFESQKIRFYLCLIRV